MAEERLPTRVGHAGWDDNRFRGHSVAEELAGSTTMWSVLSLAVGHRSLTALESTMLDDLATCSLAADPRIWPLKAIRVGSAWGDFTAGLCTGLFVIDGMHGPEPIVAAMEQLHAIKGELGADDELERIVERRLAAGRIAGFGVAVRDADERATAYQACLERRGAHELPFWSLLRRVEAITLARRGARMNIGGAMGATLLDLGFTPATARPIALMLLVPNLIANAHEGAAQAPAVLQRLPETAIRYCGPPPRKSPRAG
jgi:hypothetical protein